jgi:hypothetical protein
MVKESDDNLMEVRNFGCSVALGVVGWSSELDFGSVLRSCTAVWGVLRNGESGMVEALKRFGNIFRHGTVNLAVGEVPI